MSPTPRFLEFTVDRGVYRVDLRRHSYRFVGRSAEALEARVNRINKRQLHGLTRVFRDGRTKVFLDPTWKFTEDSPCPTCLSWIPRDSPCSHEKYECQTCGRRQCLLHWPYPMRTRREAQHFLKSAQLRTGQQCFVRSVSSRGDVGAAPVWKIFTSEADYESYVRTGRHRR
jgi:hypothetical protein